MKKTSSMSPEEVSRVAALANLSLTPAEVALFSGQLGATMDVVRRLEEIDTDAIPFPPQITGLVNIFREDTIEPSLPQKIVCQNASRTYKGYFVVEAILPE